MINAWREAQWRRYEIAVGIGAVGIEIIIVSFFIPWLLLLLVPWLAMFYIEIAFQVRLRKTIEENERKRAWNRFDQLGLP